MGGGLLLQARARTRDGIGVAETGEALDRAAYPTAWSPGEAGGRAQAGHGGKAGRREDPRLADRAIYMGN